MRRILVVLVAGVAIPASAVPASAHEAVSVKDLRLIIGWGSEPALSGFLNSVQVIVQHADDGDPVGGAKLEAEVIFGDQTLPPMELEPRFDDPSDYRGRIVPSRPGTYTFHITGRAEGIKIDETVASSDKTFDDVSSATEAEFPAKDPTRGELGDRTDRLDDRLRSVGRTASDADRTGGTALILAIVALVLGIIGVGIALARGRKAA